MCRCMLLRMDSQPLAYAVKLCVVDGVKAYQMVPLGPYH